MPILQISKKLQNDGLKNILVSKESLIGRFLHKKIVINETEDKFDIGTEINETILEKLIENKIFDIEISKTNDLENFKMVSKTSFLEKKIPIPTFAKKILEKLH